MVTSRWTTAPAPTVSPRRRGAVLERAILDAALEQLSTVGWSGLTMEGVAAGAQTGKAAVYRRWPSKEDLVADALQAGLPRFEEAPEWWHRLEIVEDEGRGNALRFIFTTDRARAEETLATGELAHADAFIRAASRSARANPEAAKTLFEMLLPLRLRETAPRQTDPNVPVVVNPSDITPRP